MVKDHTFALFNFGTLPKEDSRKYALQMFFLAFLVAFSPLFTVFTPKIWQNFNYKQRTAFN